jgi:hypothetical protein
MIDWTCLQCIGAILFIGSIKTIVFAVAQKRSRNAMTIVTFESTGRAARFDRLVGVDNTLPLTGRINHVTLWTAAMTTQGGVELDENRKAEMFAVGFRCRAQFIYFWLRL